MEDNAKVFTRWQDPTIEEQRKEIERLTAESTNWESKYYEEVEKNEKALKHIEETINFERNCNFNYWNYDGGQEEYIEMVKKTLNILRGEDNES